MSNSTLVYSTDTRVVQEQKAHRRIVGIMFDAAMRRPCTKPSCSVECDCFDASALFVGR